MSIGRMYGLYMGGETHLLLEKSRDQRWVHHAKILCSLHGSICQCLLIFTHHSLFQTKYLLMRVMVKLLTSIRFPFAILTIAIFELSVVPLNKSFYHKTIQPTKMSMQTIATTNPLGGTLKEPMLYSRCITLLAD